MHSGQLSWLNSAAQRLDLVEGRPQLLPSVQRYGDAAVLTYNLIDSVRTDAGNLEEKRWNSTAVYARIGGQWKMIHSHWSRVRTAPGEP